MPDRASIFQLVQVGVESTPGTLVAATKRMSALAIEPGIKAEVDTFMPTGSKFTTLAALGREWTTAKVSGKETYTEIIYPLSGVLNTGVMTTPSGGTTSRQWVFTPAVSVADNPKTFTVEQGDTGVRAHRFGYGLFDSFGIKIDRKSIGLSGSMIGTALEDNFTLTTAGITAIPLIPILPKQVHVKLASTQAGLTAATPLARVTAADWNIDSRFGPIWTLNRGTSYDGFVETEPKMTSKITVEADAQGMALLTSLRNGATQFIRIEAEGDIIEGSIKNMFRIDMAAKITNVSEFKDDDGLFAVEWTLTGAYDSTWNKAVEITVVNTLNSL